MSNHTEHPTKKNLTDVQTTELQTENIGKKPNFEPGDVSDIYDKLHLHSFALRAFGALLQSSNLCNFADDELYGKLHAEPELEKYNLRDGLNQIIELYLSHQEMILSEHLEQYHKSDPVLVKHARNTFQMIDQGAFISKDHIIIRLQEMLRNMDTVIERGGDLANKAEELRTVCLNYLKQFKGTDLHVIREQIKQ